MERKPEQTFNIADYLPIGHDNAVPYEKLEEVTTLSRRLLRKAFDDLDQQDNEQFVGNLQDGKGFFLFDLPNELEELESYINQESARAYAIMKRLRKMSGVARRLRYGADLKSKRLEKGYTQRELFRLTGIMTQRISQIENRKDIPTKEEMARLRKYV